MDSDLVGMRIDDNAAFSLKMTYENNGHIVNFLSTHHIGTLNYFKGLQGAIDSCNNGVYEMLTDEDAISAVTRQDLKRLYTDLAKGLSLVSQLDTLQYPSTWNRGDLSLNGFLNSHPTILNVLQEHDDHLKIRQPVAAKYGLKFRSMSFLLLRQQLENDLAENTYNRDREAKAIRQFDGLPKNGVTGFVYGALHLKYFHELLLDRGYAELTRDWMRVATYPSIDSSLMREIAQSLSSQ